MLRSLARMVACLVLLASCQTAPAWVHPYGVANPLTGSIYDVAGQRFVDEDLLADELARADIVLLGESHDNRDHHRLQARIVDRLARGGRLTAVAFEMIEIDQQRMLVEYLATERPSLDGLGEVLAWEQRGWPPFEAYRPILATGLRADAQIVAAGLPARTVDAVLAQGPQVLPPAFLQRTGLSEPLPPMLAADLGHEIATAHCGQLASNLVARMALVQRAKDASLADRLVALTGRGQGVLIAGAEHVRKDRGAPWYIARMRPEARVVSLAFVEIDQIADATPPSLAYDYVWFTPSAHPPGHRSCDRPGVILDQREARAANTVPQRGLS